MPIPPEFEEEFCNAFHMVKEFPDAASLYKVRRAVCRELGISREEFDRYLEELWKEGKVILEFGAPIEKMDWDDEINKGDPYIRVRGMKFFYVKPWGICGV